MKKELVTGLLVGMAASISLASFASANVITFDSNINYDHTVDYQPFSLDTTAALNVHLETFDAEFDPVMYLFHDDGDLSVDDYIAHNDDGGTAAWWWYNSLIDVELNADSYLVAVSDYSFSLSEALSGVNSINFANDGSYRLEISSLAGTLSAGATPTPEPATMLLFGTGLVGLAGSRARRKKK
ncbi:MAG: DVUA0089 family protein [Thermodesulfobacteriota bacterium]